MDTERWTFGINETAKLLGVAPITVRRLIYANQIPIVRVGRRVLIKKADLDSFVSSGFYNNTLRNVNEELNEVKRGI